MGLTYTSVDARGRRRTGIAEARGHVALAVTTLVSIVAIVLCYAGRIRAFEVVDGKTAASAIDLTGSPSAAALETAASLAFDNVADRRFAARELSRAFDWPSIAQTTAETYQTHWKRRNA